MNPDETLKQFKLIILIMKIGYEVFAEVLTMLYCCEKPMENNLMKYTEIRSNRFVSDEKEFLKKLEKGEVDIKDMDITLSFKLMQLTCGLEPRDSCVWNGNCPEEKKNSLEYLLYEFKEKRNDIVHQFSSIAHISDKEFMVKRREYIGNLSDIVKKAGEKAHLPSNNIKLWIDMIEFNSRMYCEQVIINPPSPMERSMSDSSIKRVAVVVEVQGSHSGLERQSTSVEHSRPVAPGLSWRDRQMSQANYNISLTLNDALLKAFALTGMDQRQTKLLNKSNRLYWIDQLITTQALYNSEQNSIYWEEYEKYLD